jgi:hypothetical protein
MADDERPLETFITLVLEHVDGELTQAHRELYPERIPEQIPLSLTLLYPWIPRASLTASDVEELRAFFEERPQLSFDLVRVAEFPGAVAYAVPEPDGDLRATMRSLWARYPDYPPYGRPGNDPAPHCTLGRLVGPAAITLEQAEARVGPLLPVRCEVTEATLFEEVERDRYSPLERLPFGL